MSASPLLPADIHVFQRGWLSSNNVLFVGEQNTALIDSGYVTHHAQTLALVDSRLGSRPLDLLLNTHLHSDHCGGNAALQLRYPKLRTHIPPGHAEQVRHWDAHALSYEPTGQLCPPFRFDALLVPGYEIRLGASDWQIHAAGGHDPHSVILFEPRQRILISADALWENGFGVVFPEIEGEEAFDEVARTLDLIESLRPMIVIPGHGAVFTQVDIALSNARQRLSKFVADPIRHAMYAAKVLVKFKLLELQSMERQRLSFWIESATYFSILQQTYFPEQNFDAWTEILIQALIQSGAARQEGALIINQ